jgi:2-oxo-4-hydroxy-4-carboxy--5-ureidoimidazoline (OHCU) decarboxylase
MARIGFIGIKERLGNDPATELRVAADEHRRITRLRLERLVEA